MAKLTELAGEETPDWFLGPLWVVGPYPEDLETSFPPEENPDPLRPVAGVALEGDEVAAQLQWEPTVLGHNDGLNLSTFFERKENIACYVYTRIFSPTEQEAGILLGSDDLHRLWQLRARLSL